MVLGIVIGVVALGVCGLVAYLVRRGDKRVDQVLNASDVIASTREQLMLKTLDGERSSFELRQTKLALEHYRAMVRNLEEYVATQAIETDDNADLAADDVAGRLVRVVRRQRQVVDSEVPGPGTRDSVPAELITELR